MEYSQSNKLLHIINAQLLDFINSGVERTGGNVLILGITYIKFCITRPGGFCYKNLLPTRTELT